MTEQPKPERIFGAALRDHRRAHNMTQEELGSALGVDVRSVQRWEQGLTTPRARKRREIYLVLGLDAAVYLKPTPSETNVGSSTAVSVSNLEYEAMSLSEYLRRGGEANFVFGRLEEIIAEWPEPPGRNNFMGTDEKWRDVAMASPDTHFYLIENGHDVVGVWSFATINDQIYRDVIRGENINCTLRPADVSHPLPGDRVSAYFIDLFRSRRTSPIRFLTHFLTSIQALLKEWSAYGVQIRRIVANLSTIEVINLVDDKLGFRFVTEHSCHTMYDRDNKVMPTQVYELDVFESVSSNKRLRRLLKEAGVLEEYDRSLSRSD